MWFQCYDQGYLKKNAQNTALDTNSVNDPNPSYHLWPGKNQAFFFFKKMADHSKSRTVFLSPISILYPRYFFSDAVKATDDIAFHQSENMNLPQGNYVRSW